MEDSISDNNFKIMRLERDRDEQHDLLILSGPFFLQNGNKGRW
jgi:hypothetical protein